MSLANVLTREIQRLNFNQNLAYTPMSKPKTGIGFPACFCIPVDLRKKKLKLMQHCIWEYYSCWNAFEWLCSSLERMEPVRNVFSFTCILPLIAMPLNYEFNVEGTILMYQIIIRVLGKKRKVVDICYLVHSKCSILPYHAFFFFLIMLKPARMCSTMTARTQKTTTNESSQ